jgi:hypothetical protein
MVSYDILYISSCGQSIRGTRAVVGWQSTRPDKRSVLGGLLLCIVAETAHRSDLGWWEQMELGFALRAGFGSRPLGWYFCFYILSWMLDVELRPGVYYLHW